MGFLSALNKLLGGKDTPKDTVKPVKNTKEEEDLLNNPASIRRIVLIGGMMCEKCDAHVKEALLKVDGVLAVRPQHDVDNAIVALSKDVPDSVLLDAVKAAGYEPRAVKPLGGTSSGHMDLPDWK